MRRIFQTKVARNGIKFNCVYYYHPALREYEKTDVLVYIKRNTSHVYVFTMKGECICKAEKDYFKETLVSKQKKPFFQCCQHCGGAVRNQ